MPDIDKRLAEIQERHQQQTGPGSLDVAFGAAQSHLVAMDATANCDTSGTRFALGLLREESVHARQDIPWLLARDKAREAVIEAAVVLRAAFGLSVCWERGKVLPCDNCGEDRFVRLNMAEVAMVIMDFDAAKENSDA